MSVVCVKINVDNNDNNYDEGGSDLIINSVTIHRTFQRAIMPPPPPKLLQ